MPVFIAALIGGLVSAAGSLVGRVLVSLGIGYVVFSGLDVSTQAQILTLLEKLAAEMGLTVAFISHDLSVIRRLCQQVIVMREGRIVEASATDALFDNPKEAYTRDLLAAIPLPEIDPDWLLPKAPA